MIFDLIDMHTSDAGVIAGLMIVYLIARWRLCHGL